MKSVLISIHPRWCELIATGDKTLEVRKTRPKLETPFKVYIYCTSGTGKNTFNVPVSHEQILRHYAETGSMECLNCPIGNGKVIGEFICKNLTYIEAGVDVFGERHLYNTAFIDKHSCLSNEELFGYLYKGQDKNNGGWVWSISNLKIYDKPKSLAEFGINKPPQSWCYVEEA